MEVSALMKDDDVMDSFNRVGNAPRVDGETGLIVTHRAGRCPRG